MKKLLLSLFILFSFIAAKSQPYQNYVFTEYPDDYYISYYQNVSTGLADSIWTGSRNIYMNLYSQLRLQSAASFTEADPGSVLGIGANNSVLKYRLDSLFSTSEFTTRARAAFSAGAGINIASGVISTAISSPVITSVATGARNFNQAYQVSTTKYVDVRVCAQVSCNLSLSGGQSGQVFLEYSADGSTNWTLAALVPASNTGTLTIGLNTTQISGGQASIILPPSYYWRMRTNNVTGTPTYTFTGGTETVY